MQEEIPVAAFDRHTRARVTGTGGQPLDEPIAHRPVQHRAGQRILRLHPRDGLRPAGILEPAIRILHAHAVVDVGGVTLRRRRVLNAAITHTTTNQVIHRFRISGTGAERIQPRNDKSPLYEEETHSRTPRDPVGDLRRRRRRRCSPMRCRPRSSPARRTSSRPSATAWRCCRARRSIRPTSVPAEQPVLLSHGRGSAAGAGAARRPHEDDDAVRGAAERADGAVRRPGARPRRRGRAAHRHRAGARTRDAFAEGSSGGHGRTHALRPASRRKSRRGDAAGRARARGGRDRIRGTAGPRARRSSSRRSPTRRPA